MADATTSRYESNYIKIAMVVLRVSPRAVRVQFDNEFHPDCLQRTLKRERGCLNDLKTKKRITQAQWNLLFPSTGEPSSKDFDITLMICLLRNLIPIDIMDRLPSATDTSLRADLSRIKYYRNLIVHCDNALVDDTDFESYWKDVTPAILRLGGNSLKVECDDWYGRNLNAEQRDDGLKSIKDEKRLALVEEELTETNKKLIELEKEQSNPVPKNIRESFTEEIEGWKKDKFFETSAVTTILEEVRNKSFVVITGSSGMGKSTIVKLVALQLQRTNDYHILPIMCPKDIVKYLDPNIKQIYIIDDICGKFSIDQSMINSWERVNSKILKYRKDNKEFRILGTCRLEISISSPYRKLLEKYEITECNLLQKKFLCSKEEKLKIAACHIDEETIKQLDDKILNRYNMFPLLCMMYASSGSNPGVRFFEYPLQAIDEQLDEMKEQNEGCFIGLALIVIYNNKLYKYLLQNKHDNKFEDVFNEVFEDLGLVNRPSRRSVLSRLQAQEGIYTKELESTITVIHDKIFDILSLYFGKRIPKTIISHGSGTFITERFLFESVEDCDDLKIVIPSDLEHSYFNRMAEEIENNRFYNVFENVQICNELYQRKFISFLSTHAHQSIIQKLLYNKWPLYLSAVNGCKLLVQFILNEQRTSEICNKLEKDGNHQDMLMDKPESDMYDCSYDSNSESESGSKIAFDRLWNLFDTDDDERTTVEDDTDDDKRNTEEDAHRIQFENSPMVAACEGGYIDIVECLVENGYNIDHSDNYVPTPLFSACKYGSKDVVDFLLKRNCKVDAMDENGQTALHAACENGNIDIVNSLLKCNSSVNLCDIDGYAPLYVACRKGHTDVVQILLDSNCDIHSHAIHVACGQGYKDIVEILIKHNVNINLVATVMYAYVVHPHIIDGTPIVYACANGHTDIVKLLLDNNCDVLDNDGFSHALHWACRGGFVDIVDLLLRNNCNINQCERRSNQSPLIVACDNNKEAVVKMLLSYEACDVNIIDGYNRNALYYACRKGHSDVVELLLRHHCNVNLNDNEMKTLLFIACEFGHVDIVKMLLSYEAWDVNIIDVYNRNALHYSCRDGHSDVVELLLRHHCNVNLNDKWMKTPLFMACQFGHVDIVKMLINQDNCMIDVLDVEGNGLLHATCEKSCQSMDFYKVRALYSPRNGRIEIIGILLGKSCDVNTLNNKGQSVLHAACEYGDPEIVDILLRNNSNVNQCDKALPLFIACEKGYIDMVRLLIESKCEIFNRSRNGQTVLHAVCSRYDRSSCRKDILTLLIDKKCDVNISDNNSQTPLHIACYKGNVALVEILLRNKCAVNQCDNWNKTPFFLACEEGHKDVVKFLMNNNCIMDIRDEMGRSALHAVCTRHSRYSHGGRDVAELLINKRCGVYDLDDAGQSALHAACRKDNPGIVKLLLKNKFDVDQCDKMGETPLFNTCREYHSDVLKLLIKWNCDVNVLNINGLNALNIVFNSFYRYIYMESQLKKMVKLLVESDCSVNICDADGRTPLHRACGEGYVDVAELLLKRYSNINQCDKLMKTPLILAVEGRHTNVVKLLVESDCSVNICDADGRTPLHRACGEGYVDVAELFLKRYSNINQCDKLMKTPLILAVEGRHTNVVTLLVENKCDIDMSDKDGRTALDIAVENRFVDIKIILLNVMKRDVCTE